MHADLAGGHGAADGPRVRAGRRWPPVPAAVTPPGGAEPAVGEWARSSATDPGSLESTSVDGIPGAVAAYRTDRGCPRPESCGERPPDSRVQQKTGCRCSPCGGLQPASGKPSGSDPSGSSRCRVSDSTSGISSRCRPRGGLDDRLADHRGAGGHRGGFVSVEPVEPHPPRDPAVYADAAGKGRGRPLAEGGLARRTRRAHGGFWDSQSHPALRHSFSFMASAFVCRALCGTRVNLSGVPAQCQGKSLHVNGRPPGTPLPSPRTR